MLVARMKTNPDIQISDQRKCLSIVAGPSWEDLMASYIKDEDAELVTFTIAKAIPCLPLLCGKGAQEADRQITIGGEVENIIYADGSQESWKIVLMVKTFNGRELKAGVLHQIDYRTDSRTGKFPLN